MKQVLNDSLILGAALTLFLYATGLALKKKYRLAILNPTLIAVLGIVAYLKATNTPFETYRQSTAILSFWLTPATVCLALPLYEKLTLLRRHWKSVTIGIMTGVLVSLSCTLLLCKLMHLTKEIYVTLLPKSITSPLGVVLSEELGGIPSITVACIIFSGIFGSVSCNAIFRLFHIRSSIARGIAIGSSSHAIGTAKAIEMGEIEAAMSSLALVLCGLLTILLAPVFAKLF